ncbi:MAG: hypothetical protein Q7S44_01780 [bacterium]|nr:hypothetical protein [bacterium]
MLNFNSVLLSSQNPAPLVDYYKQVFQMDPQWSGGEFVGFKVGDGMVVIGPHDKVHGKSINPERLILGLETADVAGEFTRIKGIEGTTVIVEPYHPAEASDMWLATLADPDGNFFQLGTPMNL